ncbi:MAG TPA: T9SS type A sorting domain-containing protein [Bacteroidia bacterium]|nr:T9SS type A sorting domain-containing protein [Bacteroidia bacterium]
MKRILYTALCLLLYYSNAFSQAIVSTYAGNGTPGLINGDTAAARFNSPFGMCMDNSGNIYIADYGNHCIRMITPAGMVSTLAGNGTAGYLDGPAATAKFANPMNVCCDGTGAIYVSDFNNQRIRKISGGLVTTIAGTGVAGYADGPDSLAQFNYPRGIVADAVGNIYIGDSWNHRIRKIDLAGNVTTYAGGGTASGVGSVGALLDATDTAARFYTPTGLGIDALGNIYVADAYNHRIRKIDLLQQVTTIAGSGSTGPGNGGYSNGAALTSLLHTPTEVFSGASGTLYIGDTFNNRVRLLYNGNLSLIAGNGSTGYVNGVDSLAAFNYPRGIVTNTTGNVIYLSDYNNHAIRKITGVDVGIETYDNFSFHIFPNPSGGTFIISSDCEKPVSVQIFNSSGALVTEETNYFPGSFINLIGYPPGVYFMLFRFENDIVSQKLVID